MIQPDGHGNTMQATPQVIETPDRPATHLKSFAAGVGSVSPPAANNYQVGVGGAAAACPPKTLLPVRVVSAFPGRIRLQASGGRCRGDRRLREFAARLALLPGVREAVVVPDANSIIVRFAAPQRDLAAVLTDIEAMTIAPPPRRTGGPPEGAERPARPGSSGALCALVGPVLKRLPAYLRLGWALAKEPAIPWRHKTLLCLFPLYCVSPVNLLAQSVPVLGLVDEAAWFLLGTRQALAHCPHPAAARHLSRLNLAPRQLEEDLETVLEVIRRVVGKVLRLSSTPRRGSDVAGRSSGGFPSGADRRRAAGRCAPLPASQHSRAAPIPGFPRYGYSAKTGGSFPARSPGNFEAEKVLRAPW